MSTTHPASATRRASPLGDPPGPRGRFPGAPALGVLRNPLRAVEAAARDHGDVVHVRVGPWHVYLLVHPDAVKDVLVTHHRRFTGLAFEAGKRIIGEGLLSAQGEAHRRQRRLVQPAFHRDRLPAYAAVMAAHAERWSARQQNGAVVAVREEMMRLTLDIVGETMFGGAEPGAADDVRALLDAGLALFGPVGAFAPRLAERMPLPLARRFVAARDRLDARVHAMLHRRRADPGDAGDLLSMLLAAQDAGDDGDGGGLTDRQVRDEVVTIFLAGHETTASALTWAWWLLAAHPEAERALHAELDAVLAGRAPTAADLPQLPYARGVFAEALRLYPTVPMVFADE
jgi:cytochrome P450